MADTYANYAALSAIEVENTGYRVTVTDKYSNVGIIGIHGGGIEPGTTELVKDIAGTDYNIYLFEGIKGSGNSALHITSTHFDEPRGLKFVAKSKFLLSVHGYSGSTPILYLGGRDEYLKGKFRKALIGIGIDVQVPPSDIDASEVDNLCNRTRINAGVQFEMTLALRQSMFDDFSGSTARSNSKNSNFYAFVNAVRGVLADINQISNTQRFMENGMLKFREVINPSGFKRHAITNKIS